MMKTIFRACLVAACLVQSPAFGAQIVKTISLNYDERDFIYQYDADSCLSVVSFKYNSLFSEDILAPALPYIPIYVLIGENQEYVGENVDATSQTLLYDVEMAANPAIMVVGKSLGNQEKRSASFSAASYPIQNVVYTGTHSIDGYKMLSFMVCPYRYEASQKNLSFLQNFCLKIELKESAATSFRRIAPTRESRMKSMVESLAVNASDMEELYPSTAARQLLRSSATSESFDYVIITNEALRPYFQPLADWKTAKGVKAKIYTTDSIYSWYPNLSTNQLKIKSFLRDYHDNYGFYYVLLGGENSIIPSQGCYGRVPMVSGDIEDWNIPTDMFYACLTDLDWDKNQDGKVGADSDHVDLGQSLYVTRALVNDSTTTKTFVRRIIDYEKNPQLDKWTSKILMGGAIDTDDLSERMGNVVFTHSGMTNRGISCCRLYNSSNDFNYPSPYCIASHLQKQLSQGYPFVDIISHGDQEYWWLENLYGIVEASELQNDSFPSIITTTACSTNQFDYTSSASGPCLSAALMQNPNSNVVAFLGCSRDNFYTILPNPSYTYGTSNYFDLMFYQTLFNGYTTPCFGRYGMLVTCAKNYLNAQNSSSSRFVSYGMNPIGDPEMPIYIEKPHTFDTMSVEMANGWLEVYMDENGAKICAMSLSDNGSSYYRIDNTDGGTLRYENIPDSLGFCITKEGFVPLTFHVYNGNIYLQNETYRGYYTLSNMSKVVIGGNVTDKKEQGPVVIKDGRFTINYTNSVTIKNNFEVKKGAELIIEKQ